MAQTERTSSQTTRTTTISTRRVSTDLLVSPPCPTPKVRQKVRPLVLLHSTQISRSTRASITEITVLIRQCQRRKVQGETSPSLTYDLRPLRRSLLSKTVRRIDNRTLRHRRPFPLLQYSPSSRPSRAIRNGELHSNARIEERVRSATSGRGGGCLWWIGSGEEWKEKIGWFRS